MQIKGLKLLESLTQAHSIPGHEDEVRKIFLDELAGHGEFGADKNGSVYCSRNSTGPKVMVEGAHGRSWVSSSKYSSEWLFKNGDRWRLVGTHALISAS